MVKPGFEPHSLVSEPRFSTCLTKILLAIYITIKGVRWKKKELGNEKGEKDQKNGIRGRISLTTG